MTNNFDALDAAINALPKPQGKEDWAYRDMPRGVVVNEENWKRLLAMAGEGNIMVLAMSVRDDDEGRWYRGQFLISPEGLENWTTYARGIQ